MNKSIWLPFAVFLYAAVACASYLITAKSIDITKLYSGATTVNNILATDGSGGFVYKDPSFYVDANIAGANPSLGTSSVTTFTDVENGSLTLTNNTSKGSTATVFIPCATGNDSNGVTCNTAGAGSTAVNESIGIAFTAPRTGKMVVCADFSHQLQDQVTNGICDTSFEIIETPNTSLTVTEEGASRVEHHIQVAGAGVNTTSPFHLCGTFSLTASTKYTFRLMFMQAVSTGISVSELLADASATVGKRDIHWTAWYLF